MKYIIWSNEGYMEFDGTCKENIASDDLYMTFDSKEEAEKYIEGLKSHDEDYGWEWLKSLRVDEAWF